MDNTLFSIEELEARFEMELVMYGDGIIADSSASQGSEAANAACCSSYTCIGTVQVGASTQVK
jgi:hypothetical protein